MINVRLVSNLRNKHAKLMSDAEYDEYVENALDEAEEFLKDPNAVYYTQEELDERVRKYLNE